MKKKNMSKKRRGRSKVKHNRFAFVRAANSEIYTEYLFIDRGQILFNRPIFCSESAAADFVRALNGATTVEERQNILGRWITDIADRFGESQRTGKPDITSKEIEMHDKNGKPLKVGDKISVVAVITETSAVDDYCNVTAKIGGDADHGPNNITSTVSLNSKQVELVGESETLAGEAVHDTAEPAASSDVIGDEPQAAQTTESSTEASSEDAEPLPDSNADVRAAAAQDGEEPGEQPTSSDEPPNEPIEQSAPVSDDPQREVDAQAPTPSADAVSNSGGHF